MTIDETLQILSLLRASYPLFYSKFKKAELESIASLWAEMFEHDDFNITKYALKELIATHTGFPPDIAALKNKIKEIVSAATEEPTNEELWQKLKKAAGNGYYGAQKEFDNLPPVLQRYLGSPNALRELAMVEVDTLNTVVHGQFLKQIGIIKEREEYERNMPAELKMLISSAHKALPNKSGLMIEGR